MSHHHEHHHSHGHHECHDCSHHHHDHDHHHHHEGGGRQLAVIIVAAVLLAVAAAIEHYAALPTWQLLLVYLVPYLLVGHDTLREAAEGLAHGDAFNEHLLMSVATIGALAIGFMPGAETQFAEAVFVMLFFQVGELFEGYAEGQSRRSIAHLVQMRPDVATVERQGKTEEADPKEVAVGEVIVVAPGARIPLDGIVVEGTTQLDTVALTGESMPRTVGVGDEALSGCVNLSGVIRLRTTRSFGQSTVSKVIELVEHAGEHKSQSEAFIHRFARIYTPVVVLAAVALAVVPPLLLMLSVHSPLLHDLLSTLNSQPSTLNNSLSTLNPQPSTLFTPWLYRALLFLVVSCPCALVISVPLTFFGGIGGASRKGILVKGANYIDVLAKVGTVVFDKTGTLTEGRFEVSAVHPDRCDEERLLHLAAHVERHSSHPIAAALRNAFPDEATDGCVVADVHEVAGQGVTARVGSDVVAVGNERLMAAAGATCTDCAACGGHHGATVVHVAINGIYAGHIVVGDHVKADSAEAVARLHSVGVTRTVMLTGDRSEVASAVAAQLGIDEVHASLLPADKVACMEQLISEKEEGKALAFVGDGINDAPVLARADVGVAMGALGSEAAIEAADVVVMDDKPSKLATAIAISRRTIGIARQNVVFAIGVKVAVLLLALFGLATMWMAVFADVGVTVLAVLNAMRALGTQGRS